MKKILKIFGLTLGGIVGVMLLVVGALFWVVFTPSRLTPIIRQVADKMVVCDYEIGRVELTFFSTFPEFGLRADTLCLVNPCEGGKQDTVLFASEVLATVDVQALLKEKHLKVHQLKLAGAEGYVYMSGDMTNLNVIALPQDTTVDTTSTALPFEKISIEELTVEAKQLILDNRNDSIDASLCNTQVYARIAGLEDVYVRLTSEDVCASVAGTVYADHLRVGAELPLALDMEMMSVELNQVALQVNEYSLLCDGIVSMQDTLSMQVHLSTEQWQIKPLLALLPASVTDMLKDIDVDGKLSLEADVAGIFSEKEMPVVDATVVLEEGKGKYAGLPYTLRDVGMEVDAHVDLNNERATHVTIHQMAAKTQYSSLQANGKVLDPLGDMRLKMRVGMNVYLPEMAYFMPENLHVQGRAKGSVDVNARLEDLLNVKLDQTKLSGSVHLYDLAGALDGMQVASPEMHVAFELPNTKPYAREVGWAYTKVDFSGLDFVQSGMHVTMGASEVALAVSDVLSKQPLLHADVQLASTGNLNVDMDTIVAHVEQPKLQAQVAYNTQDTTAIPTATLALSFANLAAQYNDIEADMQTTELEASMRCSEEDAQVPVLMAAVSTEGMHAKMDSTMEIQTEMLGVLGITQYNKRGENLLLQWNPQLQVNMLGGDVRTSMVAQQIKIPHIDFAYNNREFHIEDSQLQIGNSDFALQGDVRNIADWLSGEGDLQGELNFISDHTDVNELMALFSADSGSEEVVALSEVEQVPDESGVSEPFLVPNNLDIVLNTRIEEASVFNEKLRNLKGKLYVQDGMLVLEEIGFICKAAKLQLTAMYRTPRRNHIYVGMDYHMVDINIEELVNMLPQLDTIVPMLNSFKGRAEFHLAAETYTTAEYKIKPSTLRGACSIAGKDLVVMDSETFSKMSKMLMFSKKTENVVDSISAEITVYKKEIDVYPLCVTMDNYKVALGGRHNLDMTFNYDVNVLSPIYLGVNVSGNIDDLKIKLAKCKYAKDFRPVRTGKVEQQSAQLRGIIRESMRKNMRIESDNNNK